ncbi:MAG: hypothetical protein HS111_30660 [Kofleriaceae bacterium]|nr:hypothetical protein [Kofleriaceae bacterium]
MARAAAAGESRSESRSDNDGAGGARDGASGPAAARSADAWRGGARRFRRWAVGATCTRRGSRRRAGCARPPTAARLVQHERLDTSIDTLDRVARGAAPILAAVARDQVAVEIGEASAALPPGRATTHWTARAAIQRARGWRDRPSSRRRAAESLPATSAPTCAAAVDATFTGAAAAPPRRSIRQARLACAARRQAHRRGADAAHPALTPTRRTAITRRGCRRWRARRRGRAPRAVYPIREERAPLEGASRRPLVAAPTQSI